MKRYGNAHCLHTAISEMPLRNTS